MKYERAKIPNRSIANYTIIKTPKSKYYLSDISSEIWGLLDGQNSIQEIKEQISISHPDINVEDTVTRTLQSFVDRDLLTLESALPEVENPVLPKEGVNNKSLFAEIQKSYSDNKFIQKVDLELTYRCNLNCRHCYNTPAFQQELSTEEWKNAMDQLADMGCIDLAFTGGEVFVRKDFMELLEYACKKEFSIRLKTNGTLITKEIARQLSQAKPYLVDVEISMYGTTAATHDWFVQKEGRFDRIKESVKYLRDEDVFVVGKYLVMKQNFAETFAIPQLIKDWGIRLVISGGSMIPRVDKDKSTLDYMISDDEQRTLIEAFIKNSVSLPSPTNCNPAISRSAITPNGDVTSCEWLSDISFGNLRDASLKDIWLDSSAINQFRSHQYAVSEECRDCTVSQYCGRCPARAYLETGDPGGKSPISCKIAQICTEVVNGAAI